MSTLRISLLVALIFMWSPMALAEQTSAEWWNSLSERDQYFLIRGYWSGVVKSKMIGQAREGEFKEWASLPFNVDKAELLVDVITDFYKDPANALIWWPDLVDIARDKLYGDDIEKDLREIRGKAMEEYERHRQWEKSRGK